MRRLWARAYAAWRKWPLAGLTRDTAAVWLATRIAFIAVTYFAVSFAMTNHNETVSFGLALQKWYRKDAVWYLNIERYGYWQPTAATHSYDLGSSPTAFFPLYPLLIKAAALVVGQNNVLVAAMTISNLGVLGAFVGLAWLTAHEAGPTSGPGAARRAALIAAAYPLAFFAAAAYTDGLFFALAVFALLAARRGAWRWAVAWGVLAGLTRFTAVILVLPLWWEYGRQHGWWDWLGVRAREHGWSWRTLRAWVAGIPWPPSRAGLRAGLRAGGGAALVAGGAPIGISIYATYLWLRFGDPIKFVHAEQQGWKHEPTALWISIPHAIQIFFTLPPASFYQTRALMDYACVLFFATCTLLFARRMPFSFLLYMLGLLYISLSAPVPWSPDIFVSSGRYLIPSIPIYVQLGRWTERHPGVEVALMSVGFALLGLFTGLWVATDIGFI